ncbi:hypothetical protein D9M71_712220 [compost metagenome]
MRAVRQAHRGRGAADFFHRDHVRQVAHVGAAVFLGHGDAEHAEVAHLFPGVHRELVGAVDLARARGQFGLGPRTHGIAQHLDVFAQIEFQAWQLGHVGLLLESVCWFVLQTWSRVLTTHSVISMVATCLRRPCCST